jgi:hypothetical protein
LQKDPNKRTTFEEFFNHPFVNLPFMSSNSDLLDAISIFEHAENLDKLKGGHEALILYRQAHALLKPLIPGIIFY